jgi:hypothetical protein
MDLAAAMIAEARRRQQEKEDEKKKEKDEQESAADRDKKDQDKRQKYMVREGDTLENIATRMLRDKLLAGLIFEINNAVIPTVSRGGKKYVELPVRLVIFLPNSIDIRDYRARMVSGTAASDVVLHQTEPEYESAEQELQAKFGEHWDGTSASGSKVEGASDGEAIEDMESSARAAYQARRKHIESFLGPLAAPKSEESPASLKCTVRLGDSLKSIAIKNPLLNDVTLWKLLAEINNLSTETDEKGVPTVKLKRGQELIMPGEAQINAFRKREQRDRQSSTGVGRMAHPPAAAAPSVRNCEVCNTPAMAAASICVGCGSEFIQSKAPHSIPSALTAREAPDPSTKGVRTGRMNTGDWLSAADDDPDLMTKSILESAGFTPRIYAPKQQQQQQQQQQAPLDEDANTKVSFIRAQTDVTAPLTAAEGGLYSVMTQFSEQSRMLQAGTADNIKDGMKVRLEAFFNGSWLPVIVYEVYEDVSVRHEFRPDGFKKSIRIDLPPHAAIELATNDLTSNWDVYCEKFNIAPATFD